MTGAASGFAAEKEHWWPPGASAPHMVTAV